MGMRTDWVCCCAASAVQGLAGPGRGVGAPAPGMMAPRPQVQAPPMMRPPGGTPPMGAAAPQPGMRPPMGGEWLHSKGEGACWAGQGTVIVGRREWGKMRKVISQAIVTRMTAAVEVCLCCGLTQAAIYSGFCALQCLAARNTPFLANACCVLPVLTGPPPMGMPPPGMMARPGMPPPPGVSRTG